MIEVSLQQSVPIRYEHFFPVDVWELFERLRHRWGKKNWSVVYSCRVPTEQFITKTRFRHNT